MEITQLLVTLAPL